MSSSPSMASTAFDHVSAVSTDQWREYRSFVLKFPVLVHREGLPSALHFAAARAQPAQRLILDHLAADLNHRGRAELLRWARDLDGRELQVQTASLLERLLWYKRCVQGADREAS